MRTIYICLALAVIAAATYFLMGLDVLQPGDLSPEDAPPAITWVIGGCYIVGGGLILLRRRWLWITGAVINLLVIVFFVVMYAGRPDVMFSAPGLITKISQLLLEAGLVYLIFAWRPYD